MLQRRLAAAGDGLQSELTPAQIRRRKCSRQSGLRDWGQAPFRRRRIQAFVQGGETTEIQIGIAPLQDADRLGKSAREVVQTVEDYLVGEEEKARETRQAA